MLSRPSYLFGLALTISASLVLALPSVGSTEVSERNTPLVRAVAQCRASVVNLRGRKSVQLEDSDSNEMKQVNGMGTGVIIDPRGYILTNYHVVQGVKQIQVTTSQCEKMTGRLIAHDPESDLALLKIDSNQQLPTIPIGTSSDLMLAETVAAVGNAYGYEHTVTVGIISQLGRTVQVNDDQIYRNLIQTDAPINPGNSGGPLLNLDGKMIGINVAVRIGAQGIAFAIPSNDAMEIASRLMAQHVHEQTSLQHGMTVTTVFENHQPVLIVKDVEPMSPADRAGVEKGDRIFSINGETAVRSLDLHASVLTMSHSDELRLDVNHRGREQQVAFKLASSGDSQVNQVAWKMLGLNLKPATTQQMDGRHPNYQQGLVVTRVRENSPAELEGIMAGDILVAMHGWKTESLENLQYILEQPDIQNRKNFMFYILREKEPFWGKLRVASQW
jgi:serine protease Do